MTVQDNASEISHHGSAGAGCPQPVSLETIEVIEQALTEMLASLRRKVMAPGGQEAGAVEYESWRPRQH
jgi:hypothetical protein